MILTKTAIKNLKLELLNLCFTIYTLIVQCKDNNSYLSYFVAVTTKKQEKFTDNPLNLPYHKSEVVLDENDSIFTFQSLLFARSIKNKYKQNKKNIDFRCLRKRKIINKYTAYANINFPLIICVLFSYKVQYKQKHISTEYKKKK